MSPFRCLTVVLVGLALMQASASAEPLSHSPDQPPASPKGIQGMWVWRQQWYSNAQERAALLAFCQRWGINRLLVQVHLDRQAQPMTFRDPEALARLLADAADLGIAVEALDGAPEMAAESNQPAAMATLDAILAFNASLPPGRRFVGIHYDIEPYVSPTWKAGQPQRQQMMRDLLTFYHAVRDKLDREAPGMTLAADIPMWYDHKTQPDDSCMIEFNGQLKNLHQHIQDVCDYVGIMSYRRHALGSNSVVHHVSAELDYAEQIGKTICPALETIELKSEPQITFFGTSASEFWMQHNLVRQTLNDRPGFGGMLTHSYRGLRDLLEP